MRGLAQALPALLLLVLFGAGSGCASVDSVEFAPLEAREVCDACNRVAEPPGGARHPDGRAFCEECRGTLVVTRDEALDVLEEAREALEDTIDAEVEGDVELRLVERSELLRSAADLAHPRLRAFCQIRERYLGEELLSQEFTIHVLTSLPRDLMRGILAHELFHVWQAEAGAPEEARPAWREGSANWAQWEIHRERGETLWSEQIERDPDPTYGGGFRRFRALAEAIGAAEALDRVATREDF